MPDLRTPFIQNHFIIPLAILGSAFTLVLMLHLDLAAADWLYQAEGGSWSLRNSFLLSEVMHDGGKHLMLVLAILVLVIAAASYKVDALKAYRRPLAYLAVALLVGPLLISSLKQVTHVDCPWNLTRYGGSNPYLSLFEPHPGTYEYGKCFPAGHASAGYGLLAFYFFFLQVRPSWSKPALLVALGVGMLFGLTQQLRGAHFLSHDLATVAICWFCSLSLYGLFFRNQLEGAMQPVATF